ncbi:1420_t:CDS:2, partial [Paraglomus occultum]
QLTDEPSPYIDDSSPTAHEQLVRNSIQQQYDTRSTWQNLLMYQQQRQQQWLPQYPYSRQREVQTPNETFAPMQSVHQLDGQNAVEDMLRIVPIEFHVQSQVYPATNDPIMPQSQGNVYQVSELQSDFNPLGNGFPGQPSQTTDEQVISHRRQEEPNNAYIQMYVKVKLRSPYSGGRRFTKPLTDFRQQRS